MYDDARVIREKLDRIGGLVTLVGHSYGGLPATEAAAGAPAVTHLVYLAAHMIEQGESAVSSVGGAWYPPGTRFVPLPPDPRIALYADVPEDEANRAVARLTPQSTRSFEEELSQAAWKTIPSTYIICEQDQAMPLEYMEKMARRANTVLRMPTSHSPFLSRPAELADLIGTVALTPARSA